MRKDRRQRSAATSGKATRDEIAILGRDFSRAFANQDLDAVTAFHADDARILSPGVPLVEGKAAIVRFFEEFFAAGARTIEFETLDVLEGGDVIVEVGRSQLGLEPPGAAPARVPGKYVVVYDRQPDGSLKLVVDASSDDVP
ncbi:MAG: YybH family protein [Actinomycetota bacterium]